MENTPGAVLFSATASQAVSRAGRGDRSSVPSLYPLSTGADEVAIMWEQTIQADLAQARKSLEELQGLAGRRRVETDTLKDAVAAILRAEDALARHERRFGEV
jgi:hypothetical protein